MAITGNTNIRYTGTDAFDTAESVLDNIVDLAPMQSPVLATMKDHVLFLKESLQDIGQ